MMAYQKITVQPGFNTEATQTLNMGSWSLGNLIKFRLGLIEKMAGWKQLFSTACIGIVRALHAYEDLNSVNTLLLGTDNGPQVYANGTVNEAVLLQGIGSGVTFSSTIGSQVVTVTNSPIAVTAGDTLTFPQTVSIGGFIFPAGTQITASTGGATSFTFTLASNATRTYSGPAIVVYGMNPQSEISAGGPGASFSPPSPSTGIVTVEFAPGVQFGALTIGAQFVITQYDSKGTNIIYSAGPYTVLSFTGDGRGFTFLPPLSPRFHGPTGNNWIITTAGVSFTPYSYSSYNLPNNGLSVGQTFTPDLPTLFVSTSASGPSNTISVPVQPYTVLYVQTPDILFFQIPNQSILYTAVFQEGTIYNGPGTDLVPAPQFWLSFDGPLGPNWSIDNFGNYGLFCQEGGPIFQYTPPLASLQALVNVGPNAPQINQGMFVAMPQAQVIAFGSEAVIGGGIVDPLMVRWSDVGDQTNFVATVTNQAGDLHLSRGSRCVGGIQAPQTTLIWTDIDLWSMAYVGVQSAALSSIYDFNIVATGCGLIAQNARCILGPTVYWMGVESFWMFNANGVQPIECPVWDTIFYNLNQNFVSKIVAGANSGTQEVIFFYPSLASAGENDSYIKYNALENLWDYGTAIDSANIARSAWIDQSVFGGPLGADFSFIIQQHEVGFDDNGTAMVGSFAQTGFFDVTDGTYLMFIDHIIPDFKWTGGTSYVEVTIWATQTPGGQATMYGPFPVTSTTQTISTGGIRARQIALRVDWGRDTGFNARLGAFRFRMAPAGRV